MFRCAIVGLILLVVPAGLAAQGGELLVSGEAGTAGSSAADAKSPLPSTDQRPATKASPLPLPSNFEDRLAYGHDLYLKGDFAGALNVYNGAKEMKSSDPLVYYFIACAEAKLENFASAIEALSTMKTISGERIPSLTAKALFLIAIVEEQRQSDDDAAKAWQAYKDFIAQRRNVPDFTGTADARLSALEKKRLQYQMYEVVRQRISTAQ